MKGRKLLNTMAEGIKGNKASIIAAAAAVLIMSIIIITQVPSKADLNAEINTRTGEMAAMTNQVVKNTNDVGAIKALGALATDEELSAVSDMSTTNQGNITSLASRMNLAETGLQGALDDIATLSASPLEGYLTGTFGNYTLHARSSEAENCTANVHLVFSPPISVGNATTQDDALATFYASINWAVPSVPAYICNIAYSGNTTSWGISQVWFNIGTFELVANTEKAVAIIFGGLNSTYEPDFAYVEVFHVLK